MAKKTKRTLLPGTERSRGRLPWSAIVARVLCVVLALVGLVPVGLGVFVRTPFARGWVEHETSRLIAEAGVRASYEVHLELWPLQLVVRNLRVEASDGGSPFVTSPRLAARPKLFALMSGKVVIDEITAEAPKARIVIRKGELANLSVHLNNAKKEDDKTPFKAPFNVVSTTEASIDIDIDGMHVVGGEIDADVTSEDDPAGGSAFEIALHTGEIRSQRLRLLTEEEAKNKGVPVAVDDDVICGIDARVRYDRTRLLFRRLSLSGIADRDPAQETTPTCSTINSADKRLVEVEGSHFGISFPNESSPLRIDGHVRARAPFDLVNRIPGAPDMDGWVSVDTDIHYGPETKIPDLHGKVVVHDIRIDKFNFAREINVTYDVKREVVTSPLLTIAIADGLATITDVEVRPLEKSVPLRAKIDIKDVDFTSLMRDLGVHPNSYVGWDLDEVHVPLFAGTIFPLRIDGEVTAKTKNFAVYDAPAHGAVKGRIIGVTEALVQTHCAVRPDALEFQQSHVVTPHSVLSQGLVSIGFHNALTVDAPDIHVDLADISPIGNVKFAGKVEGEVHVSGRNNDPHIEGDIRATDFVLGDMPFGNISAGHVSLNQLVVTLAGVRATKGRSNYEVPTARLDFGGPGAVTLDARALSTDFDIRDLLAMFHMDDDPRFEPINGTIATNANVHVALGGPEDQCGGGAIDVGATTTVRDIELYGERFEDAHADFDLRWNDREAGIAGADLDLRAVALHKIHKRGASPVGSVLGAANLRHGDLRGNLVMEALPLSRIDSLGKARGVVEGGISGVARVGGTIEAFELTSDVDITPVRLLGAQLPSSQLHVTMTQKPPAAKPIGKTRCGGPITKPFDRDAYLRDTSSQGDYTVNGDLFGGQIHLDHVIASRQKDQKIAGKISLKAFDLGIVSRALAPQVAMGLGEEAESQLNDLPTGELSADIDIKELVTTDLARAEVNFTPLSFALKRKGQQLSLRTPKQMIKVAGDGVLLPVTAFDLITSNGFRGSFSLRGDAQHLTGDSDLNFVAEVAPINLGLLSAIVPKINRASGTMGGLLKVGGKVSQPTIDGELQIRGGEFAIAGLPGVISDVNADITADENELQIKRGVAKFAGGNVLLIARFPINGGKFGIAEAALIGRQLRFTPAEGTSATVDADLTITMNSQASGGAQARLPHVSGDVTLTSAEYTRPFVLDLSVLRGAAQRTVVESYDPTQDSIVLGPDLNVHTTGPIKVHNNLVDVQLGIDARGVQVSGTNQRFGLRGELSALPGGRFHFFANDFDIQRASIRFDDTTKLNPVIDVIAATDYRRLGSGGASATASGAASAVSAGSGRTGNSWRITLHAYGETDDLRVDMTSDPALSREDIFLLLTVGLTRAEVDQAQTGSLYASAAFEAAGTATGAGRVVKNVIPVFDDFRFGSAYSPTTGRSEPTVTGVRNINDDVSASITSGVGTTDTRLFRSMIEWRLNRQVSVQSTYDNVSVLGSPINLGLDLRWRLEFN